MAFAVKLQRGSKKWGGLSQLGSQWKYMVPDMYLR